MATKIFITGSNKIDKMQYAKALINVDDDLSISQVFTNDESFKDSTNEYVYYLNPTDIDLSYKNNAFLFINAKDMIYNGITFDSFYNEDIFCVGIDELNSIPDYIFEYNDTLIIWVDTKINGRDTTNEQDIFATKHFIEKLNSLNVLYFLDETPEDVAKTILCYLEGDADTKQKILDENY